MPFYNSFGIRLHYACRGADPVDASNFFLFQHGIGGDVRQPSRFLNAIEDISILHADFRGHGLSGLGPLECLSVGTLAADLAGLLDHLGIPQAILGGISMGAAAALRLAIEQPERCRALILCRPAWVDGPMSAPARESLSLVADLLVADDWRQSAREMLERSCILRGIERLCPDAAKSIRGQLQSVLSCPGIRNHAIARLRQLPFSKGVERLEDLAAVSCPTLILAAEGDPIHPFEYARKIAQALPNCRLVRIAPKSVQDDTPHIQEVDRLIGEFLRTLLPLRNARLPIQTAL